MSRSVEFDFCIITPSYRGAAFFPALYQNIIRESVGFTVDWCIVDDFSNDFGQTRSVLRTLKSTENLNIRCIFLEENHFARISVAIASSTTSAPYCLILDQDDFLANNALKHFSKYITLHDAKSDFAGVCGRCVDEKLNLIGSRDLDYEYYTNETEIRHRHKIKGEMWQCTRTSLLAEYFKDFPYGWSNGGIWSRISQNYNYIYVSDVVRVYNTSNPASVSQRKKLHFICPRQAQLAEYLRFNSKYFLYDPIGLTRKCLQYSRFAWHTKKAPAFSSIPFVARVIIVLFFPFSVVIAVKDKIEGRV